MKLLIKLGAFFNRINQSLAVFAAVLIAWMALSVALDVTMRLVIGTGILWVLEVNEFILLIMTFAAAAWVLQVDGHVKTDFLIQRLKPDAQYLANFVTSLLGAVVCLVITVISVNATWVTFVEKIQVIKALAIPRAPIMLIIPIGSFLLFVQFLRRAYRFLELWKTYRLTVDDNRQ